MMKFPKDLDLKDTDSVQPGDIIIAGGHKITCNTYATIKEVKQITGFKWVQRKK